LLGAIGKSTCTSFGVSAWNCGPYNVGCLRLRHASVCVCYAVGTMLIKKGVLRLILPNNSPFRTGNASHGRGGGEAEHGQRAVSCCCSKQITHMRPLTLIGVTTILGVRMTTTSLSDYSVVAHKSPRPWTEHSPCCFGPSGQSTMHDSMGVAKAQPCIASHE